MTQTAMLTGGCLCNAVRFAFPTASVFDAGYCHCRECQRASGAPVIAFANVPSTAFHITAGTPRRYASSAQAVRGFCGACGAQLFCAPADGAGHIAVNTGCLDDPEAPATRPRLHMFAGARLSWLTIADDLPRFSDNRLTDPGTRPRKPGG
jgi:hypothetical protein